MLDQFITAAEAVGAQIKRISDEAALLAHVDCAYGGKTLRTTKLPEAFSHPLRGCAEGPGRDPNPPTLAGPTRSGASRQRPTRR